jgi:hypothetical protein
MKEIIIKVDDDLYDQAKNSVADLETSVNEQVISYLKTLNGEEEEVASARARMKELFNSPSGFAVGQKPSREEMHERGSVR